MRETKIYLYHALGKYTRVSFMHSTETAKYMDELILYLCHLEFELQKNDTFLIKTMLKLMNGDVSIRSNIQF